MVCTSWPPGSVGDGAVPLNQAEERDDGPGEVTERPIVRHWKCRVGVKPHRGFESPPLRLPRKRPEPLSAGRSLRIVSVVSITPIYRGEKRWRSRTARR